MRTKQLEPLLGGWVQSQQRRERRPVAPQSHSTSSAERGEDVCLQTICNARRALEQTRKQTLIAQRPNRSRSRQTSWIRLNASTTEVWRLRLQEKGTGQPGPSRVSKGNAIRRHSDFRRTELGSEWYHPAWMAPCRPLCIAGVASERERAKDR